jgi:type I restriction enzyme, S subunit
MTMPKNWKTYKLGEIAEIIMGQSPAGDTCNENGIGTPLLNGPTEFGSHYPIPVQFTTDPKKISNVDDILFCVRGSTTGRMNWSDRKYAIGRGLAAIRHKEGKEYKFFLKGLIDTNLKNILGITTGSTFPNIGGEQLKEFNVITPDLRTQSQIASILSSLDNKIELNLQMNQTLEAMAQAIFKEWFVDFKFPGSTKKLVNGLPRGWTRTIFKNQLDAERGLSYKGSGLSEIGAGVPMHNLNSVYEGGGYKYEGVKYYNGEYREKHLVKPRDIIVANTEQGHKHLLIGFPAVVPLFFEGESIFSHHIYRVRPKTDSYLTPQFIYYLLLQSEVREQIIGCANGTTVNMLKIDGLELPEFNLPTEDVIINFSQSIEPLWQKQEVNYKENLTLTQIRNSLLPKLMNGTIQVKA